MWTTVVHVISMEIGRVGRDVYLSVCLVLFFREWSGLVLSGVALPCHAIHALPCLALHCFSWPGLALLRRQTVTN